MTRENCADSGEGDRELLYHVGGAGDAASIQNSRRDGPAEDSGQRGAGEANGGGVTIVQLY
jgi:hypothetical protein